MIALVWHCVEAITRKSPASIAGVIEKPCEFAGVGLLDGALPADEVEQPVLDDRSADGAAELILLQAVAHQRGGAAAVEQVVARVLEDVAVDARWCRTGWRPSPRPPACCPVCAPTELVSTLNSCSASGNGSGWFRPLKGLLAVPPSSVKEIWLALPPATESVMVGKFLLVFRSLATVPWVVAIAGQQDQLGRLARVQRQFDDFLVADDLADAAAVRFHRQGLGLHHDLFADRADLQGRVDDRVGIDVEHDAGLDVGGEAVLGDLHAVRPDREVREEERAVGAGDGGAGLAGFGLDQRTLRRAWRRRWHPGRCRKPGKWRRPAPTAAKAIPREDTAEVESISR